MMAIFTIHELAMRLRKREVSPVEITRECLDRIEKLNPALNAFITVMDQSALAEARVAEAEIGRGWTKAMGPIAYELNDSYGQFAELHLCQDGIIH